MATNGWGREIPELQYVVGKYYTKLYSLIIRSPDEEEWQEGCWEWEGRISHRNYGLFTVYKDGKRYCFQVHRIFWAISRGRWPVKILDIHHVCGNTRCVNPGHLKAISIYANRSNDAWLLHSVESSDDSEDF